MKKGKVSKIPAKSSQSPVSAAQETITNSENQGPPSPKLKWLLALSVFIVAVLLNGNTLNHGFTLDDPGIINNNTITKAPISLENIKLIFSTPLRRGQMDIENSLYRPFTKLVYNLEWNAFGGSSVAFHTINVLLYGLLGVLMFLVFYEAMNRKWLIPFLTTLLFVCHPIHTEAVANIKNGEEIIAMLGILGAIMCIQLYIRTTKVFWLFIGATAYLTALFSKESSVVAVGLFPLFIYYFTPLEAKKNLKISGVMLACALFFIFCRWKVLEGLPQLTLNPLDNLLVLAENGAERFATAVSLLGMYLQKFLIPFPLSCDYSYSALKPLGPGSPEFLISALVLMSLLIYGVKTVKAKDIKGFGIAWFFISISISCNVFLLIGTSFAERLLFMPSLGLSYLVVVAAVAFIGKVKEAPSVLQSIKSSPRIWMLFVPILIICSFKTIDRNRVWESDIKLFANDVKNYPSSAHLLFYMGNHPWWAEPSEVVNEQLSEAGYNPDQIKDSVQKENTLSLHYLSRAFNIYPELPAESYYYLGKAYNSSQRHDSAIYFLQRALGRKYSTVTNETYYELGLAYKSMNKLDSAYQYLSLACQGAPNNPSFLNNLGILLCIMNKPADALPLFKKAYEISPTVADFINNIGAVYGNLGQTDSAIAWFEKSLKLDPNNIGALNSLDFTWRSKGDIPKADQYKKRAEDVMAGKRS